MRAGCAVLALAMMPWLANGCVQQSYLVPGSQLTPQPIVGRWVDVQVEGEVIRTQVRSVSAGRLTQRRAAHVDVGRQIADLLRAHPDTPVLVRTTHPDWKPGFVLLALVGGGFAIGALLDTLDCGGPLRCDGGSATAVGGGLATLLGVPLSAIVAVHAAEPAPADAIALAEPATPSGR